MTPGSRQNFRAVSWWIEWPDLELGNPGVYDRIQSRADSFAEAVFSRSADYSPAAFADLSADVVILEIVERNLPRLLPNGDAA